TVGADAKRKQLNSFMQNIDKSLMVVFGLEYGLSTSASVHHVIPSVWILYAKWSRHIKRVSKQSLCVKSRLDPYSGPLF
ncbi:MAG: hypothetical protein OQJ74_02470, partial [Ignavibacteriaceae bacterium]|nr:hypothetical protein [Ignavibacteriaceae bacterium]